jgi:hypothetical protein
MSQSSSSDASSGNEAVISVVDVSTSSSDTSSGTCGCSGNEAVISVVSTSSSDVTVGICASAGVISITDASGFDARETEFLTSVVGASIFRSDAIGICASGASKFDATEREFVNSVVGVSIVETSRCSGTEAVISVVGASILTSDAMGICASGASKFDATGKESLTSVEVASTVVKYCSLGL